MVNREHAEREASCWIAQRASGPWGPADEAAFEAWLEASRSHQAAYYRFHAMWKETGRLTAVARRPSPEGTLSAAFEGGEERFAPEPMPQPTANRPRRSMRRALALAASAVVMTVLAGWLGWNILRSPTYSTAIGGLESVPMADGSRILMNTDSELRIALSESERRVELARGEAFFDVAKDPRRPFVVAAGSKRIVVVGTQFSVRREGDEVRVSVTDGAVRVEPAQNESGASVLLRAGSTGRSQDGAVLVEQKPLDEIEQQLTWRSGTLSFENTPLAAAVAEFNRYNARQIVIEDPSIAAVEVGGVFRATNIEPFIRLIEDGLAIGVREEKERIVLGRE